MYKTILAALVVASIATPASAQTIPCSNIVQVVLGCWLWKPLLEPTQTVRAPSDHIPKHWNQTEYPGAMRTRAEDTGGDGGGGAAGGGGSSGGAR